MNFKLRSINIHNYSEGNEKATGSATIIHNSTNMEMRIELNAEDCARILEVFADRVAQTMQEGCAQVMDSLGLSALPKSAPEVAEVEHKAKDEPADDEFPF